MFRTFLRIRAGMRLLTVIVLLLAAQRAPAPIYGLYGGLDSLDSQADAVMVVKLVRELPSEKGDMNPYRLWEVKALRSLRGPHREGTTFSANLRFHHVSERDFSNVIPWKGPGPPSLDSKVGELLLSSRNQAAKPGVYVMFAKNHPGMTIGTGPNDMHPLNNAEWSNVNSQGSLLPLSHDLPLMTNPADSVTSQVAELVSREWERAQKEKK